ncbi:hypothetical protein SB775_31490, partial [Peribacillus sp. SIMBA_075]|uniref:hypothetical protein n=1 Tax=Peribacillus sp. SIMBA_075 TaxID=3085813 RepID=UPI003978143C
MIMNKKMQIALILAVAAVGSLAATASAYAAGEAAAIHLKILNSKGFETFSQTAVTTKGEATFRQQY